MTQNITLINADVIDGLKIIESNSIDTIITSPPYYSLRNYNVDGQIGMEPTLEEYHDRLLKVTNELKRVMKPTGVLFWNHGDSYPSGGGKAMESSFNRESDIDTNSQPDYRVSAKFRSTSGKCLTMQNERLIMQMIDDQDFILRNRIIWNKPNGMPSSVKDRFTGKYESIYMLVKQKKYWFDLDAIRIPAKYQEVWSRKGSAPGTPYETTGNNPRSRWGNTKKEIANGAPPTGMKNPGDVYEMTQTEWLDYCADIYDTFTETQGDIMKIPTQPHKDAHFAIMPELLVKPLVKAGCPKSGIVLDPFAGSGTTMKVAKALGRSAIGIELSEEYCKIIKRNLLFHQHTLGNIVNKFVKL